MTQANDFIVCLIESGGEFYVYLERFIDVIQGGDYP